MVVHIPVTKALFHVGILYMVSLSLMHTPHMHWQTHAD